MFRRLGIAVTLVAIAATPAAAGGIGYRLVQISISGKHRNTLIRNQQIDVFDFSPDRRRIVFGRPGSALYASAPNGKNSVPILQLGGAEVRDAAWSPDGRHLAITVYGKLPADRATCGISVWTLSPEGGNLHKLADCSALAINNVAAPSPWANDGRLVVVGELQAPARTTGVLTLSSFDGREQRTVGGAAAIRDVAMSPSGAWVAYDEAHGRTLQVRPVRTRGGVQIPLGSGASPAWSRYGRKLAFGTTAGDDRRAGVLATVTVGASTVGRLHFLTRVRGGALPAWSPSGRRIAYVGFACRVLTPRCENDPQIYTVTVGNARPRRVSSEHDFGVISFQRLWWSPTGSAVFFTRSRSGV